MNIIFATSITIMGGGEVWMLRTLSELQKNGHQVSLLCRDDSEIKKIAQENGINAIALNFGGELNPFTILKLVRLFIKKNVDIILTNMEKETRLCGIASKISSKGKLINRRGIDLPIKNNFRNKITYKKLTEKIITNSLATKNSLLKNIDWLNENKIDVVYNGINIHEYSESNTKNLKEELKINQESKVIGFVGRLSPQKGIEYLVEAYAKIAEVYKDTYLLIVGEGELKEYCVTEFRKLNLTDKVIFTGFRKDIPNVMRTIDILVLPSLWEGFGIVLVEAMAAQKPCVASRISSIPEIVINGKTGILVDAKNSDALASALSTLLSDEEKRKVMGKNGQKLVDEKFSMSKMIQSYEKIFSELLKN